MKRKRLLLLVPTIALSFGLFGCKNADTPGPDKPDPNPPIVEVTKVTKVILSIDDESGEGSLEKPFNLKGAQGETLQIPLPGIFRIYKCQVSKYCKFSGALVLGGK